MDRKDSGTTIIELGPLDPFAPVAPAAVTPAHCIDDVKRSTPASMPGVLMSSPRGRLGDIVVELGFCERDVVETAVAAKEAGGQIGQALIDKGVLTGDQLAVALAHRFNIEYLHLDETVTDPAATQLISFSQARRMAAVPIGFADDGALVVAVVNPDNPIALDNMSMLTGKPIKPVVVSQEDLDTLLRRLSALDNDLDAELRAEEEIDLDSDVNQADDAPVIKVVRSIIADAVERGASDIHFDPADGGLSVRYRIDGVMIDATRVPRSQAPAVISRIKILAELDISEKRLPQDGRVSLVIEDRRIDVRVAVIPLVGGESAVLRILDAGLKPLSLNDLGMSADDLQRLEGALHSTHGAILATGPTGSGKTTSLYAIITLINSPEKTMMTIEDPVEYQLAGVNQVQVSERAGLTFATGLRALVRADPDVIMVGEIRDRESAHIAIESALTGHLVLSSLHTNDAPSAAMRLVDMGIEPYLVASSVTCVIAQRLARRLCPSCKRAVSVPGAHVGLLDNEEFSVFEAVGCVRCRRTGYRGRLALFEIMNVTDELRALIVNRASAHEISALAVEQGMRTLREDGLAKVRAGDTTLSELGRVLG